MRRKKRTGERIDWLHLVVTVLPEKNTFKLLKFEPKLEANQFCYAFRVTIKLEDWLERIKVVELPIVTPPETPPLLSVNHDAEHFHIFQGVTERIPKSYGEQMIERLDGRDRPVPGEKRIEVE